MIMDYMNNVWGCFFENLTLDKKNKFDTNQAVYFLSKTCRKYEEIDILFRLKLRGYLRDYPFTALVLKSPDKVKDIPPKILCEGRCVHIQPTAEGCLMVLFDLYESKKSEEFAASHGYSTSSLPLSISWSVMVSYIKGVQILSFEKGGLQD